jgi:hypothetical protein
MHIQDANDRLRDIAVAANYHVPVQPYFGSNSTLPMVSDHYKCRAAARPGSLLFQTNSAFFDVEKFVNITIAREVETSSG